MSERDEGFRKELASLINCYSRENESDTPDFILAEYLDGCLRVFDGVLQRRENWYGRKSPAAAPAAEVEKVTPELLAAHAADLAAGRHDLNGAYGCSICGTSPAPPSEPAAPEKDLLPPCTCHYAAAEFCKYHGPRLRAERAASVAPAPLLPRVLAALETWGFAALAAELRAYIATAKGEGKT